MEHNLIQEIRDGTKKITPELIKGEKLYKQIYALSYEPPGVVNYQKILDIINEIQGNANLLDFEAEAIKDNMELYLKEQEAKVKTTVKNGVVTPIKPIKLIDSMSATELDKMNIPPITWLVRGLLPLGIAVLSAPPKYYKSFMALGLCIEICKGGHFLGFECEKHACLYLDLESSYRRPKERINLIMGKETPKPENLYILTSDDIIFLKIGNGLEMQIDNQLKKHPDIKLIVIDILQLVRPPQKKITTAYTQDYDDIQALRRIASKHDIALLLIHHNRKMRDTSDVFNQLSGSTGLLGATDCTWVISKDARNDKEATLSITGRDLEAQELQIRFNRESYQWECLGTKADIEANRTQEEYSNSNIIATIKSQLKSFNGKWETTASDIIKAGDMTNKPIYIDVAQVGKKINEYEDLLHKDGIKIAKGRTSKGRKYIFEYI